MPEHECLPRFDEHYLDVPAEGSRVAAIERVCEIRRVAVPDDAFVGWLGFDRRGLPWVRVFYPASTQRLPVSLA